MNKKVGLIIGGNRGIGRAIVEALALRWGERGKVYLTARRESDALLAKTEIEQATGITVGHFVFDLSDPTDAERVSQELKDEHGYVDIVVQNGAYLPRAGHDAIDDARPMIQANSHGTLRVLEAFTPVIAENGHILIIASAMGVLHNLPEHLRPLFNSKIHDPKEINEAIDSYVDAVESGQAKSQGWPNWVNIPSKVAQVALTRSFARVSRESGTLHRTVSINAACPGVTLTDATRDFMGTVFKEEEAQSPEAAADGLMQMLTCEEDAPRFYGELLQHGEVIPFGD